MKHILMVLGLMLLISTASADVALKHQKNCETPEVKSLIGENGFCHLIIKSKPLIAEGQCTGLLLGRLPCAVNYQSNGDQVGMSIICGTNFDRPAFAQETLAEALTYEVATLIQPENGNQILKKDEMNYKIFLSEHVELSLDEENPELSVRMGSGPVKLTEVSCQ